ncbi:hypothetical protein IKT64_00110 [Candidatus Saccharibacteria bacterium]|nr:hypothetical protein [Candidatus Saccharibacteria bacterium]
MNRIERKAARIAKEHNLEYEKVLWLLDGGVSKKRTIEILEEDKKFPYYDTIGDPRKFVGLRSGLIWKSRRRGVCYGLYEGGIEYATGELQIRKKPRRFKVCCKNGIKEAHVIVK